jgi:hypothetical protein
MISVLDSDSTFDQDVANIVAGKHLLKNLSPYERRVYDDALVRVRTAGRKLITVRGAQLEYNRLKQAVDTYKQTCIEDGILIKDLEK